MGRSIPTSLTFVVDSVKAQSTLDVFNPVDVAKVFHSLRDFLAVQEPVFDEFGAIVDTRLIWWNLQYQAVRVLPVQFGQSLVETYIEPEAALEYVNQAWTAGHAFQLFELTPEKRDRYRAPGANVVLSINWQRVGKYVVEVGSDLTEYRDLQLQLADQRSLAFLANRDRALLAERERIARNLHDSVIQEIYAASLGLNALVVQRESTDSNVEQNLVQKAEKIRQIADQLSNLIKTIRDEIFDVAHVPSGSLERDLEQVLLPIVSPTPLELSLEINVDAIEDRDVMNHLRAVVREAVSNAVRHSHCSQIFLKVQRIHPSHLEVCVSDNGVGVLEILDRRSGLSNIDDRARELGGSASIERLASGGTMVRWVVPIPEWAS
jgi:signal transduction histidine kinase